MAKGKVIPLCLPLHNPDARREARRGNLGHHIIETDYMPKGIDDPVARTLGRDDYVSELWLQGSSQWDALTHVLDTEHGDYNGVAASDVHGDEETESHQWARRGIVGRGVLLDVARCLEGQGRPIDREGTMPSRSKTSRKRPRPRTSRWRSGTSCSTVSVGRHTW